MEAIIAHLESNPQHAITISFENKRMVNPFMRINKYEFTKTHIEKGWKTVEQFLKGLQKEGFGSGTKIRLTKPNGSSSKTVGEPIILQFQSEKMTQDMSHQTTNASIPTQNLHGSYYPGMNGMAGVHPAQSKLEAIEAKYDHLRENYDDLKLRYNESQSTINILKEKNNSLQLDVNTAEQRKELAVLKANLDQKSFMDSDAMKTLAANLGPVLPQVIAGQTPRVGMNAAATKSDLSNNKRQFIEFISTQNVSDDDIDFIYQLYKHAKMDAKFAAKLQELIAVKLEQL